MRVTAMYVFRSRLVLNGSILKNKKIRIRQLSCFFGHLYNRQAYFFFLLRQQVDKRCRTVQKNRANAWNQYIVNFGQTTDDGKSWFLISVTLAELKHKALYFSLSIMYSKRTNDDKDSSNWIFVNLRLRIVGHVLFECCFLFQVPFMFLFQVPFGIKTSNIKQYHRFPFPASIQFFSYRLILNCYIFLFELKYS